MDRRYDVITFDCYGTLIDWRSGIVSAFQRAAREYGIELNAKDVLREYSRIEPVVERERYRLYRDVLAETACRVARAVGWRLAFERASFLAESLPSWQPFPDTNPALERLRRAGYRLGILSNTDDDLLAATRRHLKVGFDLIITAQQVKSYKPGLPHFQSARQWIGDAEWLHAAQSNFHDIVPTNAIGVPNAWVNRNRESALSNGTPTYEVFDLNELAELLT